MFSHDSVWAALDALAARYSLTPSGLARKAGLDPTTFNKSKRHAQDGRARWPSTESIAKVIEATGASFEEFTELIRGGEHPFLGEYLQQPKSIPLLGLAEAGAGGYFDDAGFPAGQGWDIVQFPSSPEDAVYALEVSGDSMLPLYRAKILQRHTPMTIELLSFNPEYPNRSFNTNEIDWIARIMWASQ